MIGKTFGRLTVTAYSGVLKQQNMWACECSCGGKSVISAARLNSGHTKSCGCMRKGGSAVTGTPTHGHTRGGVFTPEYHSWVAMLSRCYNENTKTFPSHGGRGIKVCDRWRYSFVLFLADMGPRPKGLTLDRRNNDGEYSPENCKWSTGKEQCRNKRTTIHVTIDGVTRPLMDWCELINVKRSAVRSKVEKFGYTYEEALEYFMNKNHAVTDCEHHVER